MCRVPAIYIVVLDVPAQLACVLCAPLFVSIYHFTEIKDVTQLYDDGGDGSRTPRNAAAPSTSASLCAQTGCTHTYTHTHAVIAPHVCAYTVSVVR